MNQPIFRKTSLDNISSPDQLNDYIKVSNPRIWMVLAALFILLASVIVWGFACSLPTTIRCDGVMRNGEAVCYVSMEESAQLNLGQRVFAAVGSETLSGQVTSVAAIPLSADEIAAELQSDYLVQKLAGTDYAVKVTIALNHDEWTDNTPRRPDCNGCGAADRFFDQVGDIHA